MAEVLKVIGLMSGTSLDGVDAALLETDGEAVALPGHALTVPYDSELRAILHAALDEAAMVPAGAALPESIREAARRLTEAHVAAVKQLLREAKLAPGNVALIGFHGQTILHRPHERRTLQIGDGAALAKATGISVVNDFRSADVAAGGQGAPLVPLYHAALVREAKFALPVAVVNIGGVANVTYIDKDMVLAFDTGPGNAALDDWAHKHTGEALDKGGALARKGRVNESLLARMLSHSFFNRKPPKSLDRADFGMDAVAALSPADGAATLAAFTAAAIARAREHFPHAPTRTIISGGGRHNPVLMDDLRKRLNSQPHPSLSPKGGEGASLRAGEGDKVVVLTAEDAGWRGDFIEAEAFAYLALRSVMGSPLSLPTTTGVPKPMTGGKLHKAN